MQQNSDRILVVFKTGHMGLRSFWWLQTAGWGCFSLLSVLVVLPYVHQPGELGYRNLGDLFADQALICIAGFLASLTLRPMCHSLVQRLLPWIAIQVRAAGWSLAIGTSMVFIVSRITLVKPEPMELLEACAKMSVLLFLWCNLYFGVKQSQRRFQESEWRAEAETRNPKGSGWISRFTVRTGRRIQVVPAVDVAWISAAGDYVELHTQGASHLLRETMNSLGQKLDPARFARIHRSRIVNLDRIVEVRSIENREYIVKLVDGSQHRSSRTYAGQIESWLHSERPGD
jgi:LytTr DNA-binding domain